MTNKMTVYNNNSFIYYLGVACYAYAANNLLGHIAALVFGVYLFFKRGKMKIEENQLVISSKDGDDIVKIEEIAEAYKYRWKKRAKIMIKLKTGKEIEFPKRDPLVSKNVDIAVEIINNIMQNKPVNGEKLISLNKKTEMALFLFFGGMTMVTLLRYLGVL